MEGQFHGIGKPAPRIPMDYEAVHNNADGMLFVLIQNDIFVQKHCLAVDSHSGEAVFAESPQQIHMLPFFPVQQRGQDLHPCPLSQVHDLIHHLLCGLGRNFQAAFRAVGTAYAGEKEPQVIVDLGSGPHCGTGIPVYGALLNGNGRRKSLDGIHVGFVHLLQELPRVGG